jgi:hypothetical protein
MPDDLRDDLNWWLQALETSNGIRILPARSLPQIQLFTDASSFGLGAFWYRSTNGDWRSNTRLVIRENTLSVLREDDNLHHINVAEVQAVALALRRWGQQWNNHELVIHVDNTTALAGFRKGRLRGQSNVPLRTALLDCVRWQCQWTPIWLSSQDNALADALSRLDETTIADFLS